MNRRGGSDKLAPKHPMIPTLGAGMLVMENRGADPSGDGEPLQQESL